MLKFMAGSAVIATLALAGTAQAGPIDWQQPYFTYSPGAVDFEDLEWTPLDFAAFSAYGGYFANVRQPRFETPPAHLFYQEPDFGVEDEVKILANVLNQQTFTPLLSASAYPLFNAYEVDDESPPQGSPVPEPGLLALVGVGLLAASRSLRRRLAR